MAAHSLLRPLPLLCFLLQVTSIAYSGERGTLSGTVSDSTTGEPLAGVHVVLYDEATLLRRNATNRFGFYAFSDVAPGRYMLVALGFRGSRGEYPVTVPDSVPDVRVHLRLSQREVELNEVLVEANRAGDRAPLAVHEIRPELIKSLPSIGGEPDVFRPLQYLPGVKTSSELLGGMHVRGSSPDQNLILLDGMPLLNPTHFGGLLSVFNPDIVRSVELSKGVLEAKYGGKTSSVLNVATKEGSRERVGGSAGLSMLSTRLMLEGPLTENASFIVAGRRLYADLLVPVFADAVKSPRFYFYDCNAKLQYAPSGADKLVLTAYLGNDVLWRSRENTDVNFDINWGNNATSLRWLHLFSSKLFADVAVTYSSYSFSTRILSDPNKGYIDWLSNSSIADLTVSGKLEMQFSDAMSLKAGAELTRNRHSAEAFDKVADVERGTLAQSTAYATDASFFLQHEAKFWQSLSTTVGIRLNSFANGMFVDAEPRLSALLSLSDDFRVRGSWTISHQYLHLITRNEISFPTDLWLRSGRDVEPSRMTQSVVSIEKSFADRTYDVVLEGYHKTMKNLYAYRQMADVVAGIPSPDNFVKGTGEAYGGELLIRKNVGRFSGWIGYTLSWTTRTFPDLNNGAPFYAQYDRRHDMSLVVRYKASDRWQLSGTWTYSSGQPYTLPTGQFVFPPWQNSKHYMDFSSLNDRRLPSFHKLDLGATYSFSWFEMPFQLLINVYNAYNHHNIISRYVSYETQRNGSLKPVLKDLILFPFLPTVGISCTF